MNLNRKVIECGAMATLMVALTVYTNGTQTIPAVAKDVTETKTVVQEILLSSPFSTKVVEVEGKNVTEPTVETKTEQGESEETTKVGVLATLEAGNQLESNEIKSENQIEKVEEESSPWDEKVMAKVDEYTNIRVSQDPEAELVGKLYKGSAGDIIESGEEWTKISSGSIEGYVSNDYLAFGEDAQELANEQCETLATIQTTTLNIRKEPKVDADIVALAAEGETLSVQEQDDEWIVVNFDDITAYIAAEYVTVEQNVGQAISIEEEKEMERQKEAEAKAQAQEEAKVAATTATTTATTSEATTEVTTNSGEVAMLAAIIQCEAGSESYEGKIAVGAVVMNRVRSGAYPSSIEGVITQGGQFSPVASGSYGSVLASGASGDCYSAAQDAYMGSNNIGGALSFRGASSGIGGIVIGNHVFY